MRIIIIGAGEVGTTLAAHFSRNNDVIIVDRSPGVVATLSDSYDLLAVEGNGASIDLLKSIGVEKADTVIASTSDDLVNIAVCSTVKAIANVHTVARIKDADYLEMWRNSKNAFGIDRMVCTNPLVNPLVAHAIVRILGVTSVGDIERFVRGKVQVAEVEVNEKSPITGMAVNEIKQFGGIIFAAVMHGKETTIPRGDYRFLPEDRVIAIGEPDKIKKFVSSIGRRERGVRPEIAIFGGSTTGELITRLLEEQRFNPKMVESNPGRAGLLAETLKHAIVLQQDATDIKFLERENIHHADAVIAALENDEKNLLAALLAKHIGVKNVIAVVHHSRYLPLFRELDIGTVVSPGQVAAEKIMLLTRNPNINDLVTISPGAKLIEARLSKESGMVGKTIREIGALAPQGMIIGAIINNGRYATPHGDTVLKEGEDIVIFVKEDALDGVIGLI